MSMKKITKYLFAMSAAVIALSGCQKELAPDKVENAQEEGINLTLVAYNQPENITKTQMNPDASDVIWSQKEKFSFYVDGSYQKVGTNSNNIRVTQNLSQDGKQLTFNIKNLPNDGKELSGFLGASYCKNAEAHVSGNSGPLKGYGILLPAVQDVTTASFDPACDALVMKPIELSGISTQPIAMEYKRLFAITKLSFSGLDDHSTELVSFVKFETSTSDLAGGVTCDIQTLELTSGFTDSPSKAITLNFKTPVALNQDSKAWMVSTPVKFVTGETVTVTITTDQNIISKTITIPDGAHLDSACGNNLKLGMTGATVTPIVEKDLSGEYVIAVKEENQFIAMCAELDTKPRMLCENIEYADETCATVYEARDQKFIWTLTKQTNARNYFNIFV